MKTKKKKIKKLKSSSSKKSKNKIDLRTEGEEFWNSPQGISIKASAAGLPDPYAVRINVFEEAAKVKNYKQLERFFELYAPGMDAADVAYAAMKHVSSSNKSWSLFKILKDPDYFGEIVTLFNDIEKLGGSLAAYNHKVLDVFCKNTGYKKPKSADAFQNEIWRFKKELGLARTKTGAYTKKQLEAAAVRLSKKNLNLK
tara:strand:+ start:516 stop:1112 length:597 start_codon:yes stop_codon:yes gene_type:complete